MFHWIEKKQVECAPEFGQVVKLIDMLSLFSRF